MHELACRKKSRCVGCMGARVPVPLITHSSRWSPATLFVVTRIAQVKALEGERLKALDAAARARTEVQVRS